jgi:histidine triad (HIT) family protein
VESGCLGCQTASGGHSEDEVYRDDRVVAVVAHHAINPGHLVVVTREHVRNALTMDTELLGHMMRVARDLGRELIRALPCEGVMLVFNNEAPCQTLLHAHMHVVPRHTGDEMDLKFGDEVAAPDRRAMASKLRARL